MGKKRGKHSRHDGVVADEGVVVLVRQDAPLDGLAGSLRLGEKNCTFYSILYFVQFCILFNFVFWFFFVQLSQKYLYFAKLNSVHRHLVIEPINAFEEVQILYPNLIFSFKNKC